jgi:Tetratricopeptide repeat
MYKSHITKWKLDKKNKKHEIMALVRKKTQRDAVGKGTAFYIRGRPADLEDAFRYLKRRKISINDAINQSATTPPDLRCYTPEAVPSPPTSPMALEAPERVLINIRNYVDGNFDARTWILKDDNAFCTSTKASRDEFVALNELFENINQACNFITQGWIPQAGYLLVKGTASIRDILGEDQPRLLARLSQSMQWLQRTGGQDISRVILRQFRDMSATVLSESHPLRQIFADVCNIDSDAHQELFMQIWELYLTAFEQRLGRYSPSAHRLRLGYIREIQGRIDRESAEALLRTMIDDCERLFGVTDDRYLNTLYLLALFLCQHGQFARAQSAARDLIRNADVYESLFGTPGSCMEFRISGMEVLASCQFEKGDEQSAEATMRQAIEMSMKEYGREHPTTLGYLADLSGWLIQWGRGAEADPISEQALQILKETSVLI